MIKFRTWMAETGVVAIILSLVAYFTGGQLIQWLQALAVLATFGYVSVTNRLLELEDAKTKLDIDCYHMAMKYFVAKELLWAIIFLMAEAFPALIGIGIFLLYPLWRRWWRSIHPRKTN